MIQRLLWTFLLGAVSAGTALAEAGRVQFVVGDVRVETATGVSTVLNKGDAVQEGESIVTGASGHAQLLMADEAILAVRPATRLRIEAYHYAGKADGRERSVLALLRGGIRSITGLIGKLNRSNYSIKSPTATIGIRGTDHESLYIPPPEDGETPIGPPGTYDKVNIGETFIENASGRIEIGVNQAGYAPPTPTATPVRLPEIPTFMRNTSPVQGRDAGNRGGPETRRGPPPAGQDGQGQGQGQGQGPGQRQGQGPAQGPGPGPERAQAQAQGLPPGGQQPPAGMQGMPGPMPAAAPGGIAAAGNAPAPLPPPIKGTFDAANPPSGFVPAPNSFAMAGGDLSGGSVGSGSGSVGNDFGLVLNQQGMVVSLARSNFAYASNNAPLVQESGATIGGIPVRWGIYAGGEINNNGQLRHPSFFHFIGAPGATPPAVLSAVLASPMTFKALPGNNEYTKPIAENGAIGGSVALSITLANVSSTPSVTAYNLGVIDANARNWSASLAEGPVGLGNFLSGSGAVLNVRCTGCATGTGLGSAHGTPIGTTAIQGVISSYDLKAGNAGVTGSVVGH